MARAAISLAAAAVLLQVPGGGATAATITGYWSTEKALPFARSDQTATAMGSIIYIAGGCDGAQNCAQGQCSCSSYTQDLLAFDTTAKTYTFLPPMPTPRYRHIACAVADVIYYFGGRTLPADVIISQVDAFNTTSLTWATLPAAYPADIGSDNSCTTVGSQIFMFGGYSPFYDVSWNTTYSFSPAAGGTWTRMSSQMITGRGDFSSVGLAGKVHVYGGYTVANFCVPISSHEVYDPVANSWSIAAPLWDNIAEKDDGVVVAGRIFSIGGEKKRVAVGCTDPDIVPVLDVVSYDPASNTWSNETLLPDARMRFAAAAVGGLVYVFGGQGAVIDASFIPVLSTVYSYSHSSSSNGGGGGKTFSSSDIAGAVLGTFAVLAVFALIAVMYYRRRAGKNTLPLVESGLPMSVSSRDIKVLTANELYTAPDSLRIVAPPS